MAEIRESKRSIEFSCLRIRQPLGEFYVGVIRSPDLCAVTDFDVRRVIQDERDVERYLGIQRPLVESRVKDLKKYVNYVDASFPSSIILAVDERCAVYDDKDGVLKLSNVTTEEDPESPVLFRQVARVLDGQHRIAGLFDLAKDKLFELSVTIFVGTDISDQAYIFATVNLEQTRVQKSLAYDLFELAKTRSPQRTCHQIAVLLDRKEGSPFYHKIKRLGLSTPGRTGETITQATFVEALMRHITRDEKTDRDVLLKGQNLESVTEDELERVPLRNLFIEERDYQITDLIWNYFSAIERRWPKAWAHRGTGLMLNRTNGFRAAMRVFPKIYRYLAAPGDLVDTDEFYEVFQQSKLEEKDFNTDDFSAGTSGESKLSRSWLEEFGLD